MISAVAWGALQNGMAGTAHVAASGLIAAVWQGMLLSLLVALGLRQLPRTPAAMRFAIWFGVFLVVAALPSAGLWPHSKAAAANGHAAWFTLDERWCMILAAAWSTASLIRAATLMLAILRVRTLWKRATPFELARAVDAEKSVMHEALRFAMPGKQKGSRRAELCVSDEVDRPTVIGFFSPKILIPVWLVEKLTTAELEQIVLHEIGHLSRADDWMNLLQKIALVLFPLNPVLAWVERRLCFERELACDERVLEMTGAPKAYAVCLTSLAEYRLGRRGLALALGALGRESELGRRVRRILLREERMRPLQARLVLGGAMLLLLAAAAGFEQCPQLVGFASTADGAMQASVPVHPDDAMRGAYRYQTVVFHPPVMHAQTAAMSRMHIAAKTARADRLARRLAVSMTASAAGEDEALQTSRAEVADAYGITVGAEAIRNQAVSDEHPASGQDDSNSDAGVKNVVAQTDVRAAAQWVVVTSWRGDDGSRVVFTTVRTAVAAGSEIKGAVAMQDQVHPYAAVPVEDGWLLIQL